MNTKIRISDLNEGVWNSSKEKGEWTIVENLLEMRKSRNEPMYVFSESIDSKLFVINLSQTGYMNILEEEPRESLVITPETTMECDFCLAGLVKRIKYNLTKEVPTRYISVPQLKSKLVIHDRPYSYFILEEYDWQSNRLGDTVTSLSTFGTKTTTLNLGPGRKIFKLWIKSDTSYVLNIFSDDPLVVGNLETILLCMSKESQLLEDKCNDVANKFFKLIDSFGSPTFSMHLKTFCDSYKPEERLTKTESILVHDTFYQLLLELIKYCLGGEEMYALMILFMRWQCDPCPTDPADYNLCNCYDDGDLEYLKALERYVVRLQALFRGCYERRFMKYHDKSHRHYSKVENNLFNIYSEIFSINNRFNCSNLIRALLAHPDLDQIAEKYAARRDLENVLILKELSQKAKINEGEWTPICRQQFSVNSDDAIVIKIDLFGDLDEYVVRVIDNDTNDEIKRYTNNVTVNKYKPNERGYTVLCYAWSSITKISYCQLSFAAKKEIQQDKLLAPKISINFNSIYGIYIPNINNTICKYIIKLSSESALLTAHFTSSYPDAIIRFRLYDGKGKLLQEVTGKGDVIVPAFMLACRGKSRHHGLESTHLNKSRAAKRRVSTESRQDHEAHININANQGDESWPQRTESQRDYASQRKPHRPGSIHQVNSSSSTGLQPQVRDSIRKSQYPIRRRSSLRFSDTIVKIKSLKPHVLPYHTVFGANKANKKKTKKIQPEDFCMEVDVVDDSWPLNAEEWSNVANPMPDGQLSTFSSSVKEVTDRNDR